MVGEVTSESFEYYKFQLPSVGYAASLYEITLTPKSGGNPDIVLSLNHSNKFPTREKNDFISDKEFSNDQIKIDNEMLKAYEMKA